MCIKLVDNKNRFLQFLNCYLFVQKWKSFKFCVLLESLYEQIGCWKDKVARAIPTLEGNGNVTSIIDGHYKRRSREVEKCYLAALSLGFNTFAVQDGGQCFSSADAATTYNKYGKSTKCYGGTGGPLANDVYRINYGNCLCVRYISHQ